MNHVVKTDWSKARFEWKKLVNRSQDITRGAKCLASFLCDEYVGRNTGRCWPSNDTIADAMAVSKRTVQRHLAELLAGGWLAYVAGRGRRRTIQISFPMLSVGDSKGDTNGGPGVNSLSPQSDTDVTPYKNQVKNQVNKRAGHQSFSVIHVLETESNIIENWVRWIEDHTEHKAAGVLEVLRKDGAYFFPSRYPTEHGVNDERYVKYFESEMMKRKAERGR